MVKEITKENWIDSELKTVDLGDKRLNRRLAHLLETFSTLPTESIPAASKVWSDTKAAYRFFGHDKVNEEKILSPHYATTLERMGKERVVLLPQDTTELDYTGKNDIEGLGKIGQHEQRQGFYLHPTLAITPERVCLGVVHAKIWARENEGENKDEESDNKAKRTEKDITEKESIRWLESFRKTQELAKQIPETLLVNIADREGDIYEFFLETEENLERNSENAHWLIRSAQNRKVTESTEKLWEKARKSDPVGSIEFCMPSGRKRKARIVKQDLHMIEVTLKSPHRKGKKLRDTKIRAVLARETDTVPPNEKPIEWLLLTSLSVKNSEEALNIVEWYLCRWQIEIYFKILKSGCEVEELQLESFGKLKSCLSIYMLVAWRILFLTMMGRECPDMPCNKLFDEAEWKSVYTVIHRKPPPDTPPSLDQMIRMIASLGGFLGLADSSGK